MGLFFLLIKFAITVKYNPINFSLSIFGEIENYEFKIRLKRMYRVKRKKKKTDYNVDFKKNLINVVNGIFIKKNLLSRLISVRNLRKL